MIAAVIARLKAGVPDLGGRVEGALDLADMLRAGRVPDHAAAIVLPVAIAGRAADVVSGLFRQATAETVGVLLIARVHDQTGRRALERLRPLIQEVIEAIAGWAPAGQAGVFQLASGRIVSMTQGTLLYQVDFTIDGQLRIAT